MFARHRSRILLGLNDYIVVLVWLVGCVGNQRNRHLSLYGFWIGSRCRSLDDIIHLVHYSLRFSLPFLVYVSDAQAVFLTRHIRDFPVVPGCSDSRFCLWVYLKSINGRAVGSATVVRVNGSTKTPCLFPFDVRSI
jgi:hypothetical protein